MTHKIIYTEADDISFLEEEYTVLDVIDFGDEKAVVVDTKAGAFSIKECDHRVKDVDSDIEFTIDLAPQMDFDDELVTRRESKKVLEAESGLDGSGIAVAIVDSGIDTSHPYFDYVDVEKVDFTDSTGVDSVGHGTAVAGEVVSFAPNVDLLSLRVFGDAGSTTMPTLLKAYRWVIDNADRVDVLNMSLGSTQTSESLNRIHNKVEGAGVKTVVSSGNSGGPSGSPATAEKAWSVGACDQNGEMADFSSYNPYGATNPEVTAVGKNNKLAKSSNARMGEVLSDDFVRASGTSFASPQAAGLVASLLSQDARNPRTRIEETTNGHPSKRSGRGICQYGAAVGVEQSETTTAKVWKFVPGRDSIFLRDDWFESGEYKAINKGGGEIKLVKHDE